MHQDCVLYLLQSPMQHLVIDLPIVIPRRYICSDVGQESRALKNQDLTPHFPQTSHTNFFVDRSSHVNTQALASRIPNTYHTIHSWIAAGRYTSSI